MKPKNRSKSKTGGIEDRIQDVADVSGTSSYLFYGRSGTGKTTLAASFPKPLLLLDIRDKGTGSIIDVKGVRVLEVENLDDIEEIYYYLRDDKHNYKTVVFDTLTEMQKLVMKSVVLGKNKNKKVDESRIGDWGSMAKRDWGDVAGIMNKWIADFRDLDIKIVFLAQERVKNVDEDEEGDDNQLTPEVGPAVMPSIATTLNAAVNVIANTFISMKRSSIVKGNKKSYKEEPLYQLGTGPSPIYVRKFRKPKSAELPRSIPNPTYDDIEDIQKGI
jgi:hypothetical protein